MDVFSCNSMKEVLSRYLIGDAAEIRRGSRSRLAKDLGFHPSYLSLVMDGTAHLSQEQVFRFTNLANISGDQTAFLLSLSSFERAGTEELKQFYKDQMKEIAKRQGSVGRRLKSERLKVRIQEEEFYSNWEYQAILGCLQIKNSSSVRHVAERLGIPVLAVESVLERLKTMGLAKCSQGQWTSLKPFVHLHGDPEISRKFHLAWRLKSLEKNLVGTKQRNRNTMLFSSLITLNMNQHQKIRKAIDDMIKEVAKELEECPSEDLSVLNIDFFPLTGGAS